MATNSAAQFPYYYKSSSGDSTKWLDYLTAQYTNPSQAQLPSNTMAAQPQVASANQSTLGALQQNASSTVAASAPAAAANPTPASTSTAAIPAGLTDTSSAAATTTPAALPTATTSSTSAATPAALPGASASTPAALPSVNTGASQQTSSDPYAGVSSFALQHSYDQSNPQVQSAESAQVATDPNAMVMNAYGKMVPQWQAQLETGSIDANAAQQLGGYGLGSPISGAASLTAANPMQPWILPGGRNLTKPSPLPGQG